MTVKPKMTGRHGPARMLRRSRFPWDAIERDWRVGLLSQVEIARKYGVDNGQLSRRAKKFGWTKDLKDAVRSRALVLVRNLEEDRQRVQDATLAPHAREQTSTEDLIDDAIQTQLNVIVRHRKAIRQTQEQVDRLRDELKAHTPSPGAIDRLVANANGDSDLTSATNQLVLRSLMTLGIRSATLVNLVNAMVKLITAERQAFGLALQLLS